MIIRSTRIYLKYLRKFLAGFVSVIPFIRPNINSYPFAKENEALDKDFICIGEDLNLILNKKNERQ